jgi:hypothetical protein
METADRAVRLQMAFYASTPAGKPEEIGSAILARFGGLLDRVALYAPYRSGPELWARVLPGFATG